jgi:hypothetical protein
LAQPSFKKEEPEKAGSIVRGFHCRAGYPPLSGPAAGGGYLLPDAPKVKVGCGEIKGLAWQELGWQEWQGSNLRPPVLENECLGWRQSFLVVPCRKYQAFLSSGPW